MSSKRICIFITGASRGIGRTVAQVFSEDGSIVEKYEKGSKLVLMSRNLSGLEETKSMITNSNIEVIIIQADLSKKSDVETATKQAFDAAGDPKQYNRVVFVNNAGSLGDISKTASQHNDFTSVEDYLNLNLTSVMCQTGLFCDHFAGVDRLVINISSLAAFQPIHYSSLYCIGKAARQMYFRCLATDNPDVLVLNYGPGPVDTEMTKGLRDKSGSDGTRALFQKLFDENTILKPFVTIRKLAKVVRENLYKSGDNVDYYDIE